MSGMAGTLTMARRSAVAAVTPHDDGGADDPVAGMAIALGHRGWRVRGLVQQGSGMAGGAPVSREVRCTLRDGALAGVRQSQQMLQQELATRMAASQAHVARIEQKTDMLLSTLQRYVQGLGGELEVVARFPEVSYHLDRPGP